MSTWFIWTMVDISLIFATEQDMDFYFVLRIKSCFC